MTTPKLNKKTNISDIKTKIAIILFVTCIELLLIVVIFPSQNISPNNEILALDRGDALYENTNPGFQVLLGDRDNPGKPEITYEVEYDSDKAITLSLREVQGVNGEKTVPSFSGDPKMIDGDEDKLLYKEVIPSIDISYQITAGKGLKEDIILKEKSQIETFIFDLNVSGVEARYEDGVWWFYDASKNRRLFYFVEPYMVDSKGERSDEVKIEIRENEVTLKADKEWLNSEDREYPVTIDPSIELVILNVHSHPQQGDDWAVSFETVGIANLSIIPDDQATIDDINFVSLKCEGQQRIPEILQNDVVYFAEWKCDGEGQIVHYVNTAAPHVLKFQFGPEVGYAYNSPVETTYNFVGVTAWHCGDALTYSNDDGSDTYATVQIGDQCWMAENLNVTDGNEAQACTFTKYCYNNSSTNCDTYGGLYRWADIMCGESSSNSEPSGVQGICPNGWHIPSHYEWVTLERQACADIGNLECNSTFPKNTTTTSWRGQNTTTAEGEGSYIAGNEGLWSDSYLDGSGTGGNDFGDSGLDILPAGYRNEGGLYYNLGNYARLGTSTEQDGVNVWRRDLSYTHTDVDRGYYISKNYGYSVRCLRDNLPLPHIAYEKYGAATFTGPDDLGSAEVLDADYDNIESDNDTRWATTGADTDGHFDSQLFKFYVDEDVATISQLNLKWSGHGETQSGYTTDFYIWDYNASAWELLDSEDFLSTTDIDLTDVVNTNIGNYVDTDGEVALMIKTEKYVNACPEFSDCTCSGTGYETVSCTNGDTIYVDCNADKCWTPTAGINHAWGGYGINEPTDSCITITDRPACNYCDNLTYGGFSDWTLPTQPTLTSLCNSANCSPSICFGVDSGSSPDYWSSTESSSTWALRVAFNPGNCGLATISKNTSLNVRCIR